MADGAGRNSPGEGRATAGGGGLEAEAQAQAPWRRWAGWPDRAGLGRWQGSARLSAGKPEALLAVVTPILGAAGVLALLSLCLCLVAVACVVRARRNVVSAGPGAVASEDPVMDSVAWGSRTKHWPDSPPDQMSPTPGEAQELHYANLSFHEMLVREPQDRESPVPTEYSEIKTSK